MVRKNAEFTFEARHDDLVRFNRQERSLRCNNFQLKAHTLSELLAANYPVAAEL